MWGVIEAKLDAYVIGEDGKAGVRGRLVFKQGRIIAKSLMAEGIFPVLEVDAGRQVDIILTRGVSLKIRS